jgi:hypothetical protein
MFALLKEEKRVLKLTKKHQLGILYGAKLSFQMKDKDFLCP